jgi:hypothetical protein
MPTGKDHRVRRLPLSSLSKANKPDNPRPGSAADLVAKIVAELDKQSITFQYEHTVLWGRSRQYELSAETRPGRVEILHTLLGVELKIGRRRLLCPDLATARYLAVFARLRVDLIAVPYDISQISRIADEFESAWHRMLLLVEHFATGRTERMRARVQKTLLDQTRMEIKQLGAGTKIPNFIQDTKQRRQK